MGKEFQDRLEAALRKAHSSRESVTEKPQPKSEQPHSLSRKESTVGPLNNVETQE